MLYFSIGCNADSISYQLLNIGLHFEEDKNVDEILSSLETRMHVLTILPHIKPLNKEKSVDQLQRFVTFLCQEIHQISAADSNLIEGTYTS